MSWFLFLQTMPWSTKPCERIAEVMNIDENDVDRKYFPERHIPVIKLLVKKPPEDDGLDHSNDKPVVILAFSAERAGLFLRIAKP